MFPNCWVKGSTSSQKSLGWGSGIVVMTYRSSRKWMFLGIRLSCDFSCRTCYNNPLPTIIFIYTHKNPLVAPSILTKLHHILCCSSFAVPHWLMPPEVAVDSQEIFDAAPACKDGVCYIYATNKDHMQFHFISYFLFKKRPQEAEGTEGAMETKIKEDYVEDSQPARASWMIYMYICCS